MSVQMGDQEIPTLVVELLVAVVAIVGAAAIARLSTRRSRTTRKFRTTQAFLKKNQGKLNELVLQESPVDWFSASVPLLNRPSWVPAKPIGIDELSLNWLDRSPCPPTRSGAPAIKDREFKRMSLSGGPTYSAALVEEAGRERLFNGDIYRLVEVEPDGRSMSFLKGQYFDYLDSSEVLAHLSAKRLANHRIGVCPSRYRQSLGDPFDLCNRVASLGVNTLTLRVESSGAGFFLLQRDQGNVVNDANLISVVPAGEFTPSDRTAQSMDRDFDLWRNIMREYAEEFLGEEEARGQGGKWIDYDRSSPYLDLAKAKDAGLVGCWLLGVGLDALTWKPELLTVCIFDATVFDEIFANRQERFDEGCFLLGDAKLGLPFDEEGVTKYLQSSDLAPSSKACLELAWKHREFLRASGPRSWQQV